MPARRRVPTLPRCTAAIALAAAALVGACAAGGTSATTTTARPATKAKPASAAPAMPALCRGLKVSEIGKVSTPEATELSGLVASPDQRGVLWTHNDSGDRARVLALRTDGSLLADIDVPGAEAVDWEDIAIGPDPGGGPALFLGDIGDNKAVRDSIDVYRIPEPQLGSAVGRTPVPATRLRLHYPDGAHDAETLLVDPATAELVIITKQFDGNSGIYTARVPADPAELTLRLAGHVRLGFGSLATAGDVSADGKVIAVRAYAGFFVWARTPGRTLAATLRRTPACKGRTDFAGEGQGEALALARHGGSMLTVPEGATPVIRRYAPAR
jgi:hypothetical protein